jgi:hypothetical protein
MVGLDDRQALATLTAVVDRLIDGCPRAQSRAERAGVGVIAVQVGEQAGNRTRLSRKDLGDFDRAGSIPESAEHGRCVVEWIDDHALALRLDFHASPAKPPDTHASSIHQQ